jgi:SAM-dependent methyltransferase
MPEGGDYFEYQYRLARELLCPRLVAAGIDFKQKRVLDAGCGQGGILHFISDHFEIDIGLGVDVDSSAILRAGQRPDAKLRFEVRDFLSLDAVPGYDVVLLRDVLEHIVDVERAFFKACALVRPEGYLYASYAPFFSPFGGHQHNGTGFFSHVPWLQVFPERLFLSLIRLRGNAYKAAQELERDVQAVLATRATVRKMAALISASRMKVLFQRRYLMRPDYQIKFGIPSVALPKSYFPILTELFCTGEELLLQCP